LPASKGVCAKEVMRDTSTKIQKTKAIVGLKCADYRGDT
jgi:hypothetical protein